jgi:serine/threonine protein kinase/DNA-binding beta-propeller fold protein YncE
LSEDFPGQLDWFRQGSLLAGYRLEAPVGMGGMAVVFRARDERLGRLVALKILAPSLAADGAFRSRFIAESRAAAAVDDPHIIPVYEAGEADGVLFIAMRFVQGGDLRQVLEQEGALPPGRAAGFISPVASALDAAHASGLVHRDVKPGNILVDAHPDRPDHVYLSDFGVSKRATASVSITGKGQFIGTLRYCAPEQIQGRAVDGRADQYALACVAYQLLTGSIPFDSEEDAAVLYAHLSEPPPSLRSRRPDLSAAADQVLARALSKVPEKRYGSCREFADALREALGLAPYHPRSFPTVAGDPRSEIAEPQSEFSGSAAAALGKPGVPADPAMAATVGAVVGGGMASAADLPPASVSDNASQGPVIATVSRGPVVQTSSESRKSLGRRILIVVVAICILLAGGFLLLDRKPMPPKPPGRPEAIFRYSSTNAMGSLALSPDGKTVAVSDCVGRCNTGSGISFTSGVSHVDLWNVISGKMAIITAPYADHIFPVVMTISQDGKIIATGDENGHVYLWNLATKKITVRILTPYNQISGLAFSPDSKVLAVGTDGPTYLYSSLTGKIVATLAIRNSDGGIDGSNQIALSPDGKMLAVTDIDKGHIYIWDTITKKVISIFSDPGGHWPGPSQMIFSPNGKILATGEESGRIYLWDTMTRKITSTFTDPASGSIGGLAFNPSGKVLAAGNRNGKINLWNTMSGKITAVLVEPGRKGIGTVVFSHDGTTLAADDGANNISVWSMSWLKS